MKFIWNNKNFIQEKITDPNVIRLEETLKACSLGGYKLEGNKIALSLNKNQMENAYVFLPGDVEVVRNIKLKRKKNISGKCGYSCQNTDAFQLAGQLADHIRVLGKEDRVLVLNLANPVHPGGGVRRGARAQEEDLCRSSSLLLSLESGKAEKYYQYNRSLDNYMGSDAMILSPDVEVFRDRNGRFLEEPFQVAVLTCAAPMLKYGMEGMTNTQYKNLLYCRIEGILKVAAYYGYQYLVLGAFGCGAFGNDAHIVSDMFYKVLKEFCYNGMNAEDFFQRVEFAVLDHSPFLYNFNEFYRNFGSDHFYREENEEHIERTVLEAVLGDITKVNGIEAIVSAANSYFHVGGGVNGAIHRAAGPELLAECRTLSGCETGHSKITKAYRLPCRYVIHTVGPVWQGGTRQEAEKLASCYRTALEIALDKGIKTIAFPSVSTGSYGYPKKEAAQIAVSTVKQFIKQNPGKIKKIQWVLMDQDTYEVYNKIIQNIF